MKPPPNQRKYSSYYIAFVAPKFEATFVPYSQKLAKQFRIGLFKINFIKNNKWLSPFKSLSNEIHTDLESSEGALTFKTQHRHRHRTHCLPDPKTLKAAGLAWQ